MTESVADSSIYAELFTTLLRIEIFPDLIFGETVWLTRKGGRLLLSLTLDAFLILGVGGRP